MVPVTIEELRQNVAVSDLPDEHLQWILDRAEYRVFADGELIGKYGETADRMWIFLCGKIAFYMYTNGRQVYYFTFENNHFSGGVSGLLPYSRMKTYPGYSYALGELKVLGLHKDHFHELEMLNPDLIQKLIGYMTERAKAFATTKLQHEKVDALGKLAAGVAHELNNPAAAIRGISEELDKRLNRNYDLTKELLQFKLTPEQIQNIHELVMKKDKAVQEKNKLTTMQRMEKEDAMEVWLEENGVLHREAAETFTECGFSTLELESIRNDAGPEAFPHLIPWLENLMSSQKIIKDLEDASSRISNLVGAIKSHVHMDQTNDLQTTNLHEDIDNTLTLLGFKLRAKNIEIQKKYCESFPMVPAYIGELNQVWTNLIDNAIAAVDKNGVITIETSCDEKEVKVCIMDNGTGIPEEIKSRIFDPFFTTKKVGEGTGIGLDIVNRVVKHHNGEIDVESVPGRTRFSVMLPLGKRDGV